MTFARVPEGWIGYKLPWWQKRTRLWIAYARHAALLAVHRPHPKLVWLRAHTLAYRICTARLQA